MQYKRKDSILSMVEVPDCITAEYYDSVDMFTVESIWQLCYRNISDHKIEISTEEELSELCFNTETVFPKNLQGLADKVLEEGKAHRLNTCGLTGKGVKVAVIDRPFNSDHVEFAGRVEYIEVYPGHPHYEDPEFHGTVCAGFLSGATCGVAPESEMVYFVIPWESDVEVYYEHQLEALKKILAYNQTHDSRIRIVSLSAGFTKSQLEQRSELGKQLAETGCVLIDAVNLQRNFKGIDCVTSNGKTSYKLNRWQIDNYEMHKDRPGFKEYFNSLCFVPSARRTSPGFDSQTEYVHWSKAVSESWTIPQVAGAYACALQVNPDLRYEDFISKSKQCQRKDGFIIFDLKTILECI